MNLPWLTLQTLYAHFAWAMVLAAAGVGVLAWKKPLPMRLAAGWVVLVFVTCALPGPASPSYWLRLAFHLPSPLLLACSTMAIWAQAQGRVGHRVLPTGLAWGLLIGGALLYADTTGWLYFGFYERGFGPEAAFAGVLTGAAALLALSADAANRAASLAVLLSFMVYSLGRLPAGNVWDVLIDPLLWFWAIFSLVARFIAWRRGIRAAILTA
jgi:hypothetical protein